MSDEYGEYRGQDNASIHIHIDPDSNNPASPTLSIPTHASGSQNSFHTMFNRVRQHTRLNNVLTPNALRSFITNSNLSIQGFQPTNHNPGYHSQANQGFQYTPLINPNSITNNPVDNVHISFSDDHRPREQIESSSSIRRSRLENDSANFRSDSNSTPNARQDGNVGSIRIETNSNDGRGAYDHVRQQARLEEENNNNNNVFSDILVRFLGNFIRYIPFLIILFVKFIHDHLIGILDIALLQIVMWFVNKSLNQQVLKLSQKNVLVLIRDMGLIAVTVTYRILLEFNPDPLGLIINPPAETLTIEVSTNTSSTNVEQSAALSLLRKFLNSPSMQTTVEPGSALYVTKAISLGLLLYYVVVNDLILKLLTIWTKNLITMLPNKLLRHNQRARLYVLIEYLSQLYRSIVPMKQWGKFLFKSYSGLEVISGILLSAFYMGAKGLEFASRGKVLHQAFMSFLQNMDYERKPTKAELDVAGPTCPICHDSYSTPVILTCNHIFCDDCVGQWFKREQTCPMCRAKVSEDPLWQDGSTTFFYQLC